jgi:HAD superfamily phosphoserine phosphatase-like hydrolase
MHLTKLLEDFIEDIKKALEDLFNEKYSGRKVVAFDADGTLWKHDIGEELLRRLITARKILSIDYSQDIYAQYEAKVKISRTLGYTWAVQLMAGLSEEEVTGWSKKLAKEWIYYRDPMKKLVQAFKTAGFEVWIISASNVWIVREAAKYMGIEPEKCRGIEVEVENGFLTDRIVHPVTSEATKCDAILKWIGKTPEVAAGDSFGDLQMLEMATRLRIVIGEKDTPENAFRKLARERRWLVQLL